jgi:3'(2'), 5'-bisphosphate nucleotidase
VLLEELQQLFPSIPLVAEEDSACLRSSNAEESNGNALVESISSFVADTVSNNGSPLSHDDLLRAIDRGDKDACCLLRCKSRYLLGTL